MWKSKELHPILIQKEYEIYGHSQCPLRPISKTEADQWTSGY